MKKNIVSQERTLSVHNEHEFLLKLEKAGLNNDLAQSVIQSKNNGLAKRVVAFIQRGGYEASTSQKLAREIMGENFLGIEEVTQHFGVSFSKDQLAQLAEVGFTEAILRECKDDFILVAGYPLSLLEVRETVDRNLFYSHEDSWYNKEAFAKKEKVDLRWYLIRKDAFPGSTNKTYQEQAEMIGDNEQIPRACEVTYATMFYYLATGKRMFENIYVRCSDLDSGGGRVGVGGFDRDGLNVGDDWGDLRFSGLGVASARK